MPEHFFTLSSIQFELYQFFTAFKLKEETVTRPLNLLLNLEIIIIKEPLAVYRGYQIINEHLE